MLICDAPRNSLHIRTYRIFYVFLYCYFSSPFCFLFFFLSAIPPPKQELEKIYDGDVGDIFDIAEARGALVRRRESLVAECKACHEVG